MKTISARQTAIKVLNHYDFSPKGSVDILDKYIEQSDDKSLCKELVLGVVRNKTAIDCIVKAAANVEPSRINKRVINVIRIAVYELVYANSADYAAVNEAVEAARKFSSAKTAGFVNAVCRNVQRNIVNKSTTSEKKTQTALPVFDGNFCQFKKDVLPNPTKAPAEYLSIAFSLPQWLMESWVKNFGFEQAFDICLGSNRRPTIYLRPNTLKTNRDELCKLFEQSQIGFEIVPDSAALKIKTGKPIHTLPGFADGLFTVQDLTASKVIDNLELAPDATILDLCSAPGGKTAQLSQAFPKANIIATDTNTTRLKLVHQTCQRLSLVNVKIVEYKNLADELKKYSRLDAVLLDVPCSNTGVLAKRAEVRWRLKPESIVELAKIQRQILLDASNFIPKPQTIIFSTCSIENTENAKIVQDFLSTHKDYKLAKQELTLPHNGSLDYDGGYFAILNQN